MRERHRRVRCTFLFLCILFFGLPFPCFELAFLACSCVAIQKCLAFYSCSACFYSLAVVSTFSLNNVLLIYPFFFFNFYLTFTLLIITSADSELRQLRAPHSPSLRTSCSPLDLLLLHLCLYQRPTVTHIRTLSSPRNLFGYGHAHGRTFA